MTEYKKFAKHLADEAGTVIRSYFKTRIEIENKDDESPVTIADKKAEEVMRKLITAEFPDHGIIGEEFGDENPDAEYKWILDPIDGTKSFISGAHTFGTLIALTKNDQPVLGVINQPVLNEFIIGDNERTEFNGNPVKVRNCERLEDAVLLTTDHLLIEQHRSIENFEKLIHKVKLYRMWGDCYGYALLATGFADIMIDPVLNLWDLAALIPIVQGARGVITDYKGGNPVGGDNAVAAPPSIHKEVIDILNA